MSFKLSLKSSAFCWIFSLFTLIAYNYPFFKELSSINPHPLFLTLAFVVLLLMLNLCCSILFWPKTAKPLAIVLILINSGVFYFISAYHIFVDKIMILNLIQTDLVETGETLNFHFFLSVFLLGIIPSFLVYKTDIIFSPFKKEALKKSASALISGIIIAAILLPFRAQSRPAFDNGAKYMLLPSSYIGSIISVVKIKSKPQKELIRISEDAKLNKYWRKNKKNLIILVIGETARAANFSLGNYQRPTNRPLEKQAKNLVYFKNFKSCGTSTAISMPCLLSKDARTDFKIDSLEYTENLVDIISNGGYKALWKENNTSCKNACDRIEISKPCKNGTGKCLDGILNQDIKERALNENNDMFIIMHQRGSHGPLYYTDYPKELALYTPDCKASDPSSCPRQELINAYDNSIIYTSEVLSQTIDILKELDKTHNTALVYVSDHGESLGESGLFLHSAPYDAAPKYQTEVPFFVWMSDDFYKDYKLSKSCLRKISAQPFSHDNIFHSILSLSGVKSGLYKPELDIFSRCKL